MVAGRSGVRTDGLAGLNPEYRKILALCGAPVTPPLAAFKIIVAGDSAPGKTTLVGAISEVRPLPGPLLVHV